MLRKLILVGLVAGVSGAASADPLQIQSTTLTQTNVHNYALIAPGSVSTEITVDQTGADNNTVVDQSGDINVAEVNQRAKSGNNSDVNQDGVNQHRRGDAAIQLRRHSRRDARLHRAADQCRLPVRVQQRRREHPRADRSGQHADQQLRQDALNFEAIRLKRGGR